MILAGGRARAGVAPDPLIALVGLAAASVGAVTWAVMAGDWADGTGVVLVTALVAVVEAALVARSGSGRLVAVAAGLTLGVVVVVLLTLQSMPADGGEGIGNVAARYVRALAGGLFDTDNWIFLVGLCGGIWLLGFWVGWLAVREHRGVLALLPCYAVLAVNALNAPSLANVALPETVALGLLLLLAARVHLAGLEDAWRHDRLIALPGTRQRYGRVAAGAAGIVLLIGALVPPLTTRDVSGFLARLIPQSGQGPGHGGGRGGPGSGTPGGTVRYSPSTIPGGALTNDPHPVLSYTTSSGDSIYLRVVTDSSFSRGNWLAPQDGGPAEAALSVPSSGGLPRDRNPVDGGIAGADRSRSLQVHIIFSGAATGGSHGALFAGEPDRVSVASVAYGSDVCQTFTCATPDRSSPLLTISHVELSIDGHGGYPNSITTTGLLSTASAEQLRAAGTHYPTWLDPAYTRLPVSRADSSQLNAIAATARQWIAGATNPYDQAVAIETKLRTFKYTLSPPAPPSGEWPLTYFVETSHAGYCQYFASAMGTMLRSLGIPTRLVSGYGAGATDDSSGSTRSLTRTVTTTDAHVWVEAYFPGDGWIPFEPTPSSQFGAYDPFARNGQQPAASSSAPQTVPAPASTPRATPTPRPGAAGGTVSGGQPGAPAALVVAVLALAALVLTVGGSLAWLRRPQGLGGVWLRVRLVGRAFGVRQRPAETDAAYVRRLSRSLPPDTVTLLHPDGCAQPGSRPVRARTIDTLSVLASLGGKARFSRGGLSREEVVRWHRSWQRLCRLTPLLLWRSLLLRLASTFR